MTKKKSEFYFQDDNRSETDPNQPSHFRDGTPIPYCKEHDIAAEVMDCACNDPKQGCKMTPCHCQCHRGPKCAECEGW